MREAELPAELAAQVDGWIAGVRERHDGLATRDLRKGIQAVSNVYVESRQRGELGGRATQGPARRAAFASYYAPLHFLTTWHLLAAGEAGEFRGHGPVIDLGCGTGAVSAAVALADPGSEIEALDALGWALGEARRTYAHFGLRARTRRARLPGGLPSFREGDRIVCGWFANECNEEERAQLLRALELALKRGANVLILEPLASRAVPWWPSWVDRLGGLGLPSGLFRRNVALPEALIALDHAAGLDHSELGARWIGGRGIGEHGIGGRAIGERAGGDGTRR